MKFSKSEIKKAEKTCRKSIVNGNGRPRKLKLKDTSGKQHDLTPRQYYGLFKQYYQFRLFKGRFPNYVTYIGKANEPVFINYQDTAHTCCPASANMCLQGLFDWTSESDLRKIFQTSEVSGTDPVNMIAGLNKLGYDVKVIPRNKESVAKAQKKGHMVLAHIDTIKASCLGYRTDRNFGHYICIARITKAGNYRVFDPTKGQISCKPEIIDKAMYGRTINYYAISPKAV